MANTFFRFKKFQVDQEDCAMKVCTDACIQGAFAVKWLEDQGLDKGEILDVGTGTGLLTLMLAQALPAATADAVELDKMAFHQADRNFKNSDWAHRIHIFHKDVREWDTGKHYDFIICNPPFYENDLKSNDDFKNRAKHTVSLHYTDIVKVMDQFLKASGAGCIMLPPRQFKSFISIAARYDLYPAVTLEVKQSESAGIFRIICIFKKDPTMAEQEAISIRDNGNEYTESFRKLLKDFYLHF